MSLYCEVLESILDTVKGVAPAGKNHKQSE